jgi:hypothetical protein
LLLISISLVNIKILVSVKIIGFTQRQFMNSFTFFSTSRVRVYTRMKFYIGYRFFISLNNSFFKLSLSQFLILSLVPDIPLDLFIFIWKCIKLISFYSLSYYYFDNPGFTYPSSFTAHNRYKLNFSLSFIK